LIVLLKSYGVALNFCNPFKGSVVTGYARFLENGHLVIIVGNRETEEESIANVLLHLLGHAINGDVNGSFIDFKTSNNPADKKADQW
jgi:hypothetical protein